MLPRFIYITFSVEKLNNVDGIIKSNVHSINDVDSVGLGVNDVVLHEAAESRQVCRDRRDSHHGTLGRSIPPENKNKQL